MTEEIVQTNTTIVTYLPYIVSVLCAVISGITTYAVTRRQTRAEFQKLEKQYHLDIEKEREKFAMEKEKMEIAHQYEMELKEKELEAALGTSVLNEAMKIPEVRQQIAQGVRQGKKGKR